jgi:hypothetical protein
VLSRPARLGALMAFGYPVLLELAGRRAVVAGAFAVEAGKVEGLLAAGAEVTVIAKGPRRPWTAWSGTRRVTVHRRDYQGPADLTGRSSASPPPPSRGPRLPSPPTPAPPASSSTSWTTSPTATSPPRRSSAAATW